MKLARFMNPEQTKFRQFSIRCGASGRRPKVACILCRKALSVKVFAESVAEGKRMEHFYREFDPGSG